MTPPRAPLDPCADKTRIVIDYGGVQIEDARDNIRVVVKGETPKGMRACLRVEGFKAASDGAWERRNSPDAIFKAQEIVTLFLGELN